MLVVDQSQELVGVWNKVLDVMRYDVSVSLTVVWAAY